MSLPELKPVFDAYVDDPTPSNKNAVITALTGHGITDNMMRTRILDAIVRMERWGTKNG